MREEREERGEKKKSYSDLVVALDQPLASAVQNHLVSAFAVACCGKHFPHAAFVEM